LPGEIDRVTFAAPRLVSFAAGAHTGYRFSATGTVSGTKAYTLAKASAAQATARAIINGSPYLLISNGVWVGYWMPESNRVILH
jgi:hypothetical protein